MAEEGFKRKLTTMFSADVAGYGRLMAKDETATVKTLKAYRGIMTELIKQHRGRVVDSPGDNVLAEFTSVVDAVQCAVSVQKELQARNAELPEDRRMEFRIGINLGDVIEEEDRIYGDGVNIAARLESLADPGGICISKTAFDHIETKLPLGYEYLGEQTVKNIAKPVGAYRVLMEPRVTVAEEIEKEKTVPVCRRKIVVAGGIALVLVVIGALIWNFYLRRPPMEVASVERMAYPLPDKPSIAVLPFTNMSEDPEQEYFSDGLTEEIITALSKTPKVFIIARHSTFTYKGKSVTVQQVGRELGVRYVLEGSVRKAGNKLRITAQLIDATTEKHLWAERYDRDMKDVFAIQDEITLEIIKAMQVELTMGEMARVTGKGTKNLDAYLKALRAREQWWRMDKEGSMKARQLAMEAISLDPQYGYPYAIVSHCHMLDLWLQSTTSPKESMRLADEAIQKALALDDSDYRIHRVLSNLYVMQGKNDEAVATSKRALELSPSDADSYENMGVSLSFACKDGEAVPMFEKAIELNPFPPAVYFRNLAMAYRGVGRYEDAIAKGKNSLQINSNDYFTHLGLVLAYVKLGRREEASAAAAEVLKINPKFSLDWWAKTRVKMVPTECQSRFYDNAELLRTADVGLN
ncbi:MAG: tetratricopeptide repeat protein [Proteobacteria bacterium]|nr:tetratricopeptide repeat protein [Pseudomonadota bacterium]